MLLWRFYGLVVLIVLVSGHMKYNDEGGVDVAKRQPGMPMDMHGRIRMGVKNPECDEGKDPLKLDYNGALIERTCFRDSVVLEENLLPGIHRFCDKVPFNNHVCMNETIRYEEIPPIGGPHRPLWAKWGEYDFIPQQRWLHNVEHGAAVFLYHPCLNRESIVKLKDFARGCIYRHIITPYRLLNPQQPMAIITYGCKLTMSHFDYEIAKKFVKENAASFGIAPEGKLAKDGQFDDRLIQHANIVTSENDDIICPNDRELACFSSGRNICRQRRWPRDA